MFCTSSACLHDSVSLWSAKQEHQITASVYAYMLHLNCLLCFKHLTIYEWTPDRLRVKPDACHLIRTGRTIDQVSIARQPTGGGCMPPGPGLDPPLVDWHKTEEKPVPIYISYEISFSLVFWDGELFVRDRGVTPSTWNFGSTGPRWSEIADFEQIFARSGSAVTTSEKSAINTACNRQSTTRFPVSLRWSSYVAPKPLKPQNGSFPSISHFAWRKAATKFHCAKTVSDEVVRHLLV